MPESERAELLSKSCAGDEGLRAAVESLLAHDPERETAAGEPDPLRDAVESLAEAATGDGPAGPSRLGPYLVEGLLGRGGMGAVYLARRADDQYEQHVAIKVIPSFAGEEAEQRFRLERQVLALLDHPNIARLYDGGTTEDGQPYLVMEHVRGRNLVEHCQEQDLPLARRLELFAQVCGAVDYAHRRFIVHRDLKPSNVLVADDGLPRLLDFGVAKALEPTEIPQGAPRTSTLHRILTPGYASPEQVRGEQITTATDVFGLGLLLYELICDRPAQAVTDLHPRALEREICEVEPTAPTALRSGGDRLSKGLARDLDSIVLLALRKDPGERYASVRELAEDLERWLAGEPVRARRPTLTYLTTKFLGRHRVGASVLALLLIAGVLFVALLEAERRRTRTEARTSRVMSEFLVEALTSVAPQRARGEVVTLLEVLDAATARLETRLHGEPALRAHLQGRIGAVYGSLSRYETSRALLAEAAETLRREAPGSRELIATLADLGESLNGVGELEAARSVLEEALSLHRELGPEPSVESVEALNELGLVLVNLGHPSQAVPLFEEAIVARAVLPADANHDALLLDYNLAQTRIDLGDVETAHAELRRLAEARRRRDGEDHPRYVLTIRTLAQAAHLLGRTEESVRLSAEAVEGARRIYGPTHLQYLDTINNAANQHHDRGNYPEAERYYLEAIEIAREHGYEGELPLYLNNLGALYRDMGEPERSVAWFRESVEIRRRVFGEESPRTASAERNLAGALIHTGELGAARELLERVVALYTATDRPLQALRSRQELGRWHLAAGAPDRAEAVLEEVVESSRTELGPDHPRVALALADLARVRLRLGRPEEAAAGFRRARDLLVAVPGPDPLQVAKVEVGLATALVAASSPSEEVRALVDHAEPILRARLVSEASVLRELDAVRRSLD